MWFVVYIEGPLLLFQTSRWFSWPTFSKWLFNIFRLRGAQNVGVYTMWHQIPSASGPYPQLRSLRHSPYLAYCFRAMAVSRGIFVGSFALSVIPLGSSRRLPCL